MYFIFFIMLYIFEKYVGTLITERTFISHRLSNFLIVINNNELIHYSKGLFLNIQHKLLSISLCLII